MRIFTTAASIIALTFGFAGAAAAAPDTFKPAVQSAPLQVAGMQKDRTKHQYPDADVDSSRQGTSMDEAHPGSRVQGAREGGDPGSTPSHRRGTSLSEPHPGTDVKKDPQTAEEREPYPEDKGNVGIDRD